jgi:hypothetical protein
MILALALVTTRVRFVVQSGRTCELMRISSDKYSLTCAPRLPHGLQLSRGPVLDIFRRIVVEVGRDERIFQSSCAVVVPPLERLGDRSLTRYLLSAHSQRNGGDLESPR